MKTAQHARSVCLVDRLGVAGTRRQLVTPPTLTQVSRRYGAEGRISGSGEGSERTGVSSVSPVPKREAPLAGDGQLDVLVVDDEADMRLLVSFVLRPVIRRMEQVSSGNEALARCLEAREAYDLVVLDQRMPDMSGTEVARRLREQGVRTPIILFSAYLSDEVEAEAGALGLTLVDKLDLTRLESEVARVIQSRE